MSDKLKNIIMFAGIVVVLFLAYMFFTGKEETGLVTEDYLGTGAPASNGNTSALSGDFLPILLSIRGIKLDTSIFSDPAFLSLRDSTIELVPDGNEGRPNPFAPIGSDAGAVTIGPGTPP